MKSIKETLEELPFSSKIMENYEKMKEELLHDDRIQAFLIQNPLVTPEMITRSLSKASEYVKGRNHCDHCPGLSTCPNLLKGYQPSLAVEGQTLTVKYEPCSLKVKDDFAKQRSNLIKTYYVPKEILQATFDGLDKKGRFNAIKAAADFVKSYRPGQKTRGLYVYGEFGVGKTYIMGAIMNALADKFNIESLMVYTPDFFRELKGSISDQTLDGKIDYIKKVSVLILDDIGAETMSPWIRDEVLGSILQFRIMEGLPTLYTSNCDYDLLEDHLAYSHKTGTELLKAKRIMERIRHYTTPVSVEGTNRRGW